jgi:hypothetical protein
VIAAVTGDDLLLAGASEYVVVVPDEFDLLVATA